MHCKDCDLCKLGKFILKVFKVFQSQNELTGFEKQPNCSVQEPITV